MSELNDLITRLCPNGVPYKKLDDLVDIGTGSSNTQDQEPDGIYPFYVRSPEVKRSSSFEFDETAVITAGDGDVGKIFHFVEGKYALHQRAYRIKPTSSSLNAKFLYYYMKVNFRAYVERKACSATVKSLRKPMFQNFEIPVPPLPVQAEIVRILDSFTTLEAELEAELADRKKQYEYYRDYLLDKNTLERMDGKPVEMKKLGEVEEDGLIKLGRGNVISKRDIANNPGIYPIYSASVTNNGKFGEYGNYMFDDIRLTWSIDGGGRFFYRDDEKYSVTNVCGWLKVLDANAFNPKFLFYVLTSQWNNLVFNYTVKAHPSVIRNIYDIPMVSLSTQERVVDILDRFDTLTTSLTDGIPAEIAMRREQYEYYRSRLLDFPRLPDGSASVSDSE